MFRAFAVLSLLLTGTAVLADDRPNLILIIADDMAWDDCGAYGHPHIKTPNLDRMAKEGMRFDHAYLTCSSCSPSRSSTITGRFPHSTGGAHQLHNPLPGSQITFVEKLKATGYYTAASGKWHLGNETKIKFDKVTEGRKECGPSGCENWVKTLQERPKDKPFFGWFAAYDPHRSYSPNTIPEPHTKDDIVVPPYLPDVAETREDLGLYYDEISRLDSFVGKVLDELDKQNIAENTFVVFISDNGRPFPRCKTTVYESGVKTPFIVRYPKVVKAGSVSSALVSTVDIAPTMLALAGVEAGKSFQGVSFEKVLTSPHANVRRYTYAEHNWHDFEDFQRAVISKRWLYIRTWYTDVPGTPPADAVKSITFQKMHALKKAGQLTPAQLNPYVVPRPEEELYDLENDPHQLNNLAGKAEASPALERYRGILADWQHDTDDTFPEKRRADEFDRITGNRLKVKK